MDAHVRCENQVMRVYTRGTGAIWHDVTFVFDRFWPVFRGPRARARAECCRSAPSSDIMCVPWMCMFGVKIRSWECILAAQELYGTMSNSFLTVFSSFFPCNFLLSCPIHLKLCRIVSMVVLHQFTTGISITMRGGGAGAIWHNVTFCRTIGLPLHAANYHLQQGGNMERSNYQSWLRWRDGFVKRNNT